MGVFDNYLYLTVKHTTAAGVSMERINLEKNKTGSLDFSVNLDRLVQITGVFDEATNLTTFTTPYADPSINMQIVDAADGSLLQGITKESDTTYTAYGDLSDGLYYVGKKYNMKYQLSEWFYKPTGQNTAYIKGRLQMRQITLGFRHTGYFTVTVTPYNREALVQEYTSRVIGEYVIGTVPLKTDTATFILMCNSKNSTIVIESDSYVPCELHSINLTGFFVSHSKPI
jgi:hypothetical protein